MPPLEGETRADVCIVGAGFVGLWTALHIRDSDPSCDVVLLDRAECGSGASGRNGGFTLTWWPKIEVLRTLCGTDEALRLARATDDAVGAIGTFCQHHHIDADFVRDGWLWSSANPAQDGAWTSVLRCCEALGVEPFREIAAAEAATSTGSAVHRSGVIERGAAIVQPAALAHGLRRVALERGVRIYEHTPVVSVDRSRPCVVRVARGRVRAERVVIATGAWAAAMPELAPYLIVVSSDIVATEPAPELLHSCGWTSRLSITDSQLRVHYYRTTRDGRIVFGKGGGTLAFGGRVSASYDRSSPRARVVTEDFRRMYPRFDAVPVTHDWSGAVDRTVNSLPLLGHLPGSPHILCGVGWSGHGVGPSHLGGRILASLALDRRDEWSGCGVVNRFGARFPPEPIRWVGGNIVKAAVGRKERAEWRGRTPSRLTSTIARLAPHE